MQESRNVTIGIAATPTEKDRAKRAAEAHGTDLSNLLRRRSLRWVLREGERLEQQDQAA
jgi:hypothetical protein